MSFSPQNRFAAIRQIHAQAESLDDALDSHTPKRGRPATGKRSNPDWVGRTYYIRRQTDCDVHAELFLLKRQGVDIDKSQLVDALLAAWAKARHARNPSLLHDESLSLL